MRPGSAGDAAHCRRIAADLGLPIEVSTATAPCRGEAEAREVRYRALGEMADAAGAPSIATAHTLDDDAETVILRLARGGYPLGIPPRRGRVVRPLLSLRRRDTEEVCRERGVPTLSDPSNDDDRIARNRVRHTVMPSLGDEGIEALAAVGAAAHRTKQRCDASVETLLASLRRDAPFFSSFTAPGAVEYKKKRVRLDRSGLAALPPALQVAVLRRCLQSLGLEPTTRLVQDLAAKVVPVTGARLDLPGGLAAWSEAGEVVIGAAPPSEVRQSVELVVPGRTSLPEWGLLVHVEQVAPPDSPRTGPWEALLDAGSATGPLAVRARRPGDRFRPLGAPGERKLQDVLVDLKVPRASRDRVPLLTSGDRLAWVGGYRIDDRFKLTGRSTAALKVVVDLSV
jgi:tRNA(Ile)-lysidine synthase